MSSIKHDSAGFLIGDLIESSNNLLKSQQAGLSLTRAIRADVSAIARAMGVSARSNVPGRTNRAVAEPAGRAAAHGAAGPRGNGRQGAVAMARGRGADGRFSASVPVNRSAIKKIATETDKAQTVEGARDNRGRFAGGGGAAENERSGVGGLLADKFGKFADAFKGMGQSGENVDPAITAMGEIKSVLEPFGRGAFALLGLGGEKKKERWYGKILKALTGRKDPTVVGGGGVDSGDGAVAGAMAGMVARFVGPLVGIIGGALVAMAPVIGAALAAAVAAVVAVWLVKKAADALAPVIKEAKANFSKGMDDVNRPVAPKGQTLDASGRDLNDPRRLDRKDAAGTDGRAINDPRRLDLAKPDNLPPANSFSESAGRGAGHVKNGLEAMGYKPLDASNDPLSKGYRERNSRKGGPSVAEIRALQTGTDYKAGNISGLNDAQTRALVASTALTESGGGKLGAVNEKSGYIGRYQAGAGWLADAGLMRGGGAAVKAAMNADGFKSETKWGESGNMTKFLKNDANWKDGMSYKGYMGSADVQDAAFKKNSDRVYASLMKNGAITSSTPPEQVAGLLKAGHLAGPGGALAMSKNGTGPKDANGTTTRKYYDDMATDRNGFLSAYGGKISTTGVQAVATPAIPASVPQKIPSTPEVTMPAPAAPEKDKPLVITTKELVGQNVGDRTIAHIASGGIGMVA
jgi:hypothetical protein